LKWKGYVSYAKFNPLSEADNPKQDCAARLAMSPGGHAIVSSSSHPSARLATVTEQQNQ